MKKIAASDSRQSVGLKWKLRKGLEKNIGFNGTKTEVGGDLEVDGNILSGLIGKATLPLKEGEETLLTLDCWVGEGVKMDGEAYSKFYVAIIPLSADGNLQIASVCPICKFYASESDYDLCGTMDEVIGKGFIPFDLMVSFGLETFENASQMYQEIQREINDAKYIHGVTIKFDSTGNSVLAFTAMSNNDLQITSIQNIGAVFGGCLLACSGGDNTGVRYVYLDTTHGENRVGYLDSTGFKTDKTLESMVGEGFTIEDVTRKMG